MVTLVAYFLIFLARALALIFGRRSGGQSSDRDDDGGFDIGWPLFWMWGWGPSTPGRYGRQRRMRRSGKPLYKKVFEYVFGPPQPKLDPLLDEKEILAYIRAHNGRIAAVDLVASMGWEFPRAEEEATRLLIDYGGEPEVSDDGVVLFVFKDVRKTAQDLGADVVRPRRAWERMETRPPLTGNTGTTDVAISILNGFNLIAPFWIVPRFEERLGHALGHPFLFYVYPVIFSSMIFGVPLGRWLVEKVRDRGRKRRNARRGLLRVAIERKGAPLPLEEITQDPETAKVLDASLIALGGDVVTDDNGQIRYAFPRIKRELEAVARARAEAPDVEEKAGEVVFSSKDRA
jgi:hypothetical protein